MARTGFEASGEVTTQRATLIADTQEWLGRAANLMSAVRQQFPYTSFASCAYRGQNDTIQKTGLTSPRIVLPARPLMSYSSDEPVFTRRSAATVELRYDTAVLGIEEVRALSHSKEPFPVPQQVHIGQTQPVAIASEAGRPTSEVYQYADRFSISGQRLDLFPWLVADFGASLPHNEHHRPDCDELRDFATLCAYPEEALWEHPDSLDFHRRQLDVFIGTLGTVALALQDESLNPRRREAD